MSWLFWKCLPASHFNPNTHTRIQNVYFHALFPPPLFRNYPPSSWNTDHDRWTDTSAAYFDSGGGKCERLLWGFCDQPNICEPSQASAALFKGLLCDLRLKQVAFVMKRYVKLDLKKNRATFNSKPVYLGRNDIWVPRSKWQFETIGQDAEGAWLHMACSDQIS